MGHNKHRDTVGLSQLHQQVAAGADLGNTARGRLQCIGVHGLDRVNDQECRMHGFTHGGDIFHIRLRHDKQRVRHFPADAVRPHLDLLFRLLAGHIQNVFPPGSDVRRCLQDQGGLSDEEEVHGYPDDAFEETTEYQEEEPEEELGEEEQPEEEPKKKRGFFSRWRRKK